MIWRNDSTVLYVRDSPDYSYREVLPVLFQKLDQLFNKKCPIVKILRELVFVLKKRSVILKKVKIFSTCTNPFREYFIKINYRNRPTPCRQKSL